MVSADTNRPRSALRRRLVRGTALVAVVSIGGAVEAADIPQAGTVVNLGSPMTPDSVRVNLDAAGFGAAGATIAVPVATTNLGIEVQQARTVINWGEFNIGTTTSMGTTTNNVVNFTAAAGITNYAVLNRVLSPVTASTIAGTLSSSPGGQIFLINRAGIVFGATARIDTGAFVGSALDIANTSFATLGGSPSFTFTSAAIAANAGSATETTPGGATISLDAPSGMTNGLFTGGPLLLVAPQITTGGRMVAGGDVGLVVAQAATVQLSNTSILGIEISAGTTLAGNRLNLMTGSTTSGTRVFAVAAAQVDPVAALLNVQGSVTASAATMGANGIVLSAGADAGAANIVTVTDPGAVATSASIGTGALLTSANTIAVAASKDVAIGGTARFTNTATGGDTAVDAARDVQISGTGTVASGAALTVTAGRDVHLTGARTFASNTTFDAAQDVAIDTLSNTASFDAAATLMAGRDVVINSAETLALGGTATITAARDVTITLPELGATGALAITAGDDIRIAADMGAIAVDSATTTGLGMDSEADGSSDVVVTATTMQSSVNVGAADAARDIVLNSDTMATLGTAVATRDIVLAGASVSLTDGLAGRDISLTGMGAAGAINATVVTNARAGDDVRVISTNGAASVTAATSSGFQLNATRTGFGAAAATDTDGDGNSVFVQAAQAATLNAANARTDVVLVGASASASGTLTAGDDVTVVARSGNASVNRAIAQGTADSEASNATLLVDAAGATINDPTKMAATGIASLAGSNVLVIASGNAGITGTPVSMSARDLRVVAGNTSAATLNNGTAARDLLLLGGSASGTGTLTAGDDVTVVARNGAASIATAISTGLGPDSEGGSDAVVLTDATGGTINDPTKMASIGLASLAGSNVLVIASGNAGITGTTSVSARDLRVVAGDAATATLNTGTATRDLLLLGGSVSGTGTLMAGDDVTVVARSGNASIGTAIATGLAADSETDDTTVLTDATGGTLNDPTKMAATGIASLAGSNVLVIASGNAGITGTPVSMSARDLRVVAGNTSAATLNNGTAARDLLLLGGSASGTGTLTAGDDVTVVARAGAASIATAISTGLGPDSEAGSDAVVLTDATGGTINDPTKMASIGLASLAGSNVLVIASGNAGITGTTSVSARDLRVVAGDAATATLNTGTATRDLLLLGGSVSGTGTLMAGDDVTVVARSGNASIGTAIATGLGADSETNDTTVLTDATGGTLNDPTKMAATGIASLAGSNVLVIASGNAGITGTPVSMSARDLRVVAGNTSAATLNNGTAARDLLLLGGSASGTGTLTAGDDVTVVARNGAASIATAISTGLGPDSEAGSDAVVLTDATGGTINDPTKMASIGLASLAGSNVLVIASGNAGITGTTSVSARDLRVVAGDAATATLNTGTATRDLLLLGGSVSGTGTLMAGDDVTVVARSGNASIGTAIATGLAADSETNDTTVLTDATGGTLNDPTKMAATGIASLAGSNVLVIASGNAGITGTPVSMSARDLRVVAGNTSAATLNNGTAARDLLLLGGSAAGTGTLTAGDDVTVVARAGAASIATAISTGLGPDSEAGSDAVVLTDATGGTINDPTKMASIGLASLAGSNVLVIASGNAGITGTTSVSARDLRVVAGDAATATLNTGTATRDLLLLGGSVSGTGTLMAGDDVTVVARSGNASIGTAIATGLAADSETDDTTVLTDATGGTLNDPTKMAATGIASLAGSNVLVIASGNAGITGTPVSMSARDLRVVAGNTSAATLNNGTAARDLLLLGGSASGTGTLTAGDDVTVVARAGAASIATAISTGLGPDSEAGSDTTVLTDATGGTINDPTKMASIGLASLAGSNVLVIASGNAGITGTTSVSARDLRVVAGDAATATLNTGTATRDLLLLGGSVSGTGTLMAGDDVTVVARSGNASIGTAIATGLAADSETNDTTVLTDATGGVLNDPTKMAATGIASLAGSNVLVIASGDSSAASASAPRDVRVVAGTDASLAVGTAGRDLLLLAGGAAVSATSLTAGDDVAVVAGGAAIVAFAGLAATAGADSEAGSDAAVLRDASGAAVADPYLWQGHANIDTLAGRNLVIVGTTGVTAPLLGDGALRPRTVRAVTAGGDSTVTTGFAGNLLLVGSRSGAATLVTGDSLGDIIVKADAGAATLTGGTAGRDIQLLAGTTATLVNGTAGDDIYVLAGGNADVMQAAVLGTSDDDAVGSVLLDEYGNAALGTSTGAVIGQIDGSNINVQAGGTATVVLATARQGVGGDVRVGAVGAALVTTASAARDVLVDAGGAATATTLVANRDVTVLGASADVSRAVAGDDVVVAARTGAATVTLAQAYGQTLGLDPANAATFGVPTGTAAADSESDAAAVRVDLAGAAVADPSGTGSIRGLTGSNLFVAGSTGATLGTGVAAADIKLATAGGTAVLTDGRAGRDLLVAGPAVRVETLALAGDDLALVARAGDVVVTDGADVRATGQAFAAATGTYSGAVGSGPDSEAAETAALADLSGNAVADPVAGGAAIDRLVGANLIVAASGNAALGGTTTVSAARDVRVVAGGDAVLDTGTAGRDLLLAGATATSANSLSAGDDLAVVARAGDAVVTLVTATGAGADSETADTALLLGASSTAVDDPTKAAGFALTRLSGSNVLVVASGNAVVPTASAPRDVRVVAGTDASLAVGTAGRDLLLLAGGDAVSATSLTAGDDVAVVAGGAASVAVATATGAGADSEASDATALFDASGVGIANPAAGSGAGDIARLTGSNIVLAAAGTVASTGTAYAAGDVRLASSGDVTFSDVRAGRDLLVVGSSVTGANAQAGDDAALVARSGAVAVTTLASTGLGLDATTGASLGTAAADSETDSAGLAGLANGSTISDPTKAAATALTGFAGSNVLAIAATTVTVPTASAPRDVRVVAGTDASLATGTAGRDLLLLAGGDAVSATSLTAGDDVAVVAGGAASVAVATATGAGADSEAGDATALFDASGVGIVNPAAGSGAGDIARLTGSNIVVAAAGTVASTGTAYAAGDVRLASSNAVTFSDVRAGRDLLVVGSSVTGANAQAGDDAALVARTGAVAVTTLASTGLGLDATTGASLGTAAADSEIDSAGLAGLANGSTISDPTKAAATALTGFAGSNVLAIAATTVTVPTASAPRDVRVVAGTDASLAVGTAGRDLLLLAGGDAVSATSLTAGDDVAVVARGGNAMVATARATGMGANSDASDTTALVDASGAAINDASVPGSTMALANLAGANLLVAASGNASVTNGQAARDIRVAAGSDATLTNGIATGRDIILDAGATAHASGLDAGRNLIVTSSDIDLFSTAAPLPVAAPLVVAANAVQFNIRNRNTGAATSAVVIGDVTSAPAASNVSWTLDNRELAAIRANTIDFAAGARTVTIGDATPYANTAGMPTRVGKLAVATSGVINVVGLLNFSGGGRVLTLGGTTATADAATDATADIIAVVSSQNLPVATAQPNGQIQADGGTVRLRARVVAVGQPITFQSEILPAGTPLAQQQIINNYFLNTQSSLYRALPPYSQPAAAAIYLRASTLNLTIGDYALLQNTDARVQPGGGSAVGAINIFSATAGDPTIALFGSINGFDSVAASLQINSITLNGISPVNVRVNGCIALQGSGCVVSNVVIPDPTLGNPSSAFLLTVAPSLTLPIDLISGATNEALWRNDRCDPDDPQCRNPEPRP